jgi:hypothetical protein
MRLEALIEMLTVVSAEPTDRHRQIAQHGGSARESLRRYTQMEQYALLLSRNDVVKPPFGDGVNSFAYAGLKQLIEQMPPNPNEPPLKMLREKQRVLIGNGKEFKERGLTQKREGDLLIATGFMLYRAHMLTGFPFVKDVATVQFHRTVPVTEQLTKNVWRTSGFQYVDMVYRNAWALV